MLWGKGLGEIRDSFEGREKVYFFFRRGEGSGIVFIFFVL